MSPVVILGPGLIGGSLGLALKDRIPEIEVRVWARRSESLAAVRALGFASVTTTDLAEAVVGAGMVVFCTPVESMAGLAKDLLPFLSPTAVVTDAGSVKASVVRDLEPILGGRFVGSHPIAGSEKAGIASASAKLYVDAPCIVTPGSGSPATSVALVTELWRAVGAIVLTMTPAAHDAALARTSHLPHVAAAALVATVAQTVPNWPGLVGGGFRDSTRIAASNPDLWTGILLANAAETSSSIAEFIEILQKLQALLATRDADAIRAWLAGTQAARQHLTSAPHGI